VGKAEPHHTNEYGQQDEGNEEKKREGRNRDGGIGRSEKK
jgi:hypothetical protein